MERGEDIMTREEALRKAINIVRYFEAHFAKSKEAREDAVNIIEALEQEPTGWIPVSERLPKEFESVLACYKSQGGMAQCVTERLVDVDGSNYWLAMYGQEPIAWMPLPEPYKAESEV